ncbi:MAG: hypothetical protein ABI840_11120 [bacterium]
MKNDFIPRRSASLDAYEENFLAILEEFSATLDIEPEEVAAAKELIISHRNSYTRMNLIKQLSLSADEDQRSKKTAALNELRRLAKMIKSSNKYDRSFGDIFGITSPVRNVIIPEDMQPELKAVFNGQKVLIKYRKQLADGIKLFSKRADEKEFREIGIETSPKFIDSTDKLEAAKPEEREYYGVYVSNYKEVGHRSDTIKVVVP